MPRGALSSQSTSHRAHRAPTVPSVRSVVIAPSSAASSYPTTPRPAL